MRMLSRSHTSQRDQGDTTDSAAKRTKLLQGAIGFVVMFAILWWVISRVQSED